MYTESLRCRPSKLRASVRLIPRTVFCYPRYTQASPIRLAEFHALVVRDGMHPQAVHQAFLVIDEYREVISPDIEGASRETAA